MANSILCFKNRHVRLPDKDIAIVFEFLLLSVKKLDDKGLLDLKDFKDVVKSWVQSINNSGPGTIDVDFDGYVCSPEVKKQMILVFDEVKSEIGSFGESIPAALLDNIGPGRMNILESDTRSILVAVDEIVSMFK
jgi:hypothetical protein